MVAEERLESEPLSALVPDSEGEGTTEYPGKKVEPKTLVKADWLGKLPEILLDGRLVPVAYSLVSDEGRALDGFFGFRVTVYMIMGGVKGAEESLGFVELGNVVAGEIRDNVKLARLVIVELSVLLLISLVGSIDDVLSFNGVVDESLSLSGMEVGWLVGDIGVELVVGVLSSLLLSLSESMVVDDGRSLEGSTIGADDGVEEAGYVLPSLSLSLSESVLVEDGRSLEGGTNGADDGVEEARYVLSSLLLSFSESMVVEDGRSLEGSTNGADDGVEEAGYVLSSLSLSLSELVLVEDGRSLEGSTTGTSDGVTVAVRLDGLSLSLPESSNETTSSRSLPSAREVHVSNLQCTEDVRAQVPVALGTSCSDHEKVDRLTISPEARLVG